MIIIVDYGLGNIHAFLTLYKRFGIEAESAKSASDLDDATHLILPGIGVFDYAMELLGHMVFSTIQRKAITSGWLY